MKRNLSKLFIFSLLFAGMFLVLNSEIKAQLTVVKTGIEVAYKGRIEASDQIIAFGTGMIKGVDYIRPGDTKPRGIPASERFSSLFFAVAGEKIVLANPQDFTISVFDTATGKMTDIPEAQIKLYRVSGSMYDGGGVQASGNYAVVITDTSGGDSAGLKVLDLSAAEPKIIPFKGSGRVFSRQIKFTQVAIDEKSGLAAGATPDYEIVLFNFKNPQAEPKVVSLENYKGVGKAQIRFDNGKILFHSGEAYPRAMILDTATEKLTELSRAVHHLALRGGSYVYFAERDAKDLNGITARAAVGKIGGQPTFVAADTPVDGSTKNNGVLGFGSSAAITPDGRQIFIAGAEDIGRTERFQVYRAGKFALQPDASVKPAFLQASDVVASSNVVAFKLGADNRTTLGYIKLK